MTLFSEERQTYLAHQIIDGLWKDDLVDYEDEERAIRAAKKAFADFEHELASVDQKVREKIASLKKTIVEGSQDWDIMYKKYMEEEMNRRGN